MRRSITAEMSLCNDNWYGYLEKWIYDNEITWMEKTVASPYWTGMMLMSIDSRQRGRRKHNMLTQMYAHEDRIAFKGQLFSAPLDWQSLLEQLRDVETTKRMYRCPSLAPCWLHAFELLFLQAS